MNIFEKVLSEYIKEERLDKIQQFKIGIAGAGGLGSNCAFNLVRSGFKKFVIVDFDVVEPSNLNRQFYFFDQLQIPKVEALKANLLRINPDLRIEILQTKLDGENIKEVFKDCDVIIEAFDKVIYKTMLAESFFSSGKLLVSASGLGGWGKSDDIVIRKVHDKFYIVGDFESEVNEEIPPISPRVNIVAAKQADIVLDSVLGDKRNINCTKKEKLNTDLYCITAEEYSKGRSNIEVVGKMINAGVKVIQYREKDKKLLHKYNECLKIRAMTKEAGVTFIINDDIDIAILVKADGVHIGQDDIPIEKVRELVGAEMIIGLSTHSPEQAQDAVRRGADYIGVGPIYKTATKKDVCDPVGLEYLSYVANNIPIPYVAIGGIKEHNMMEVAKHGAKCIAMVTEIVGADNIGEKIINIKDKMNRGAK